MNGDRRHLTGAEERDDRRAERRTQLLDAAVDAIRTMGPSVTMEQLAKAGGVTKPILYRHFGDRDGLIGAIAERFSNDLLTSVTTPLATDATARELLRSTVDSYVSFIDTALPRSHVRLRNDANQFNFRPTRAEYLFPADGFRVPETRVHVQEFNTYVEYGLNEWFSTFMETPYKWVNPDRNQNISGIGTLTLPSSLTSSGL